MQYSTKEAVRDPAERVGVSGIKVFDGDRKAMQAIQMKDWLTQQMEEKAMKKQLTQEEKRKYEEQTMTITQMGKTQEEIQKEKRRQMARAVQEQNLLLAKEKKDREARDKAQKIYMDTKEIEYTATNDFMTENPDTCASVMSATRVKKYHWKGMNEAQKGEIMRTIQEQIEDKKKKIQMEKEAEQLWAEQEEAKRLMLVRQTLEKQRKERDMNQALKETHMLQTSEKKEKWGNYYGEKLGFEKPTA